MAVLRPRRPRIASAAAGGDVTVLPGRGTIEVAGLAPGVAANVTASPGAGSLSVAGLAPSVAAATTASPGAGTITVAGFAPDVAAGVTASPGAGAITVAGFAPSIAAGITAAPGAGAISVAGLAPVVSIGASVIAAPGAGAIVLDGFAPAVAVLVAVSPGAGSIAVAGFAPDVAAGVTVSPGAGTLAVGGLVPVVALTASEIPVRTAMLDAIVTALSDAAITIRGVPVTIARSRTDTIEEAERPLLAVVGGNMDQVSGGFTTTLYRLRVILAGYVGAASEQDAEEDAALLHAYAIRALIRPDPADAPATLLLADGNEVWIEEAGMAVEPASVVQSEVPAASCLIVLTAQAEAPLGNPFITA
jgi:hypothetical protein